MIKSAILTTVATATATEVPAVLSAISQVGFPIVCVIAMARYVKYITDNNREEINRINEKHATEMKEITTAINNNTLALQRLCDKFGSEE